MTLLVKLCINTTANANNSNVIQLYSFVEQSYPILNAFVGKLMRKYAFGIWCNAVIVVIQFLVKVPHVDLGECWPAFN